MTQPPNATHQQRAREAADSVKNQLPSVWLGGRQYHVLVAVIAHAISDAEARGATAEREAIEKLALTYLGGLAASHSWLPLKEFLEAIRQREGVP